MPLLVNVVQGAVVLVSYSPITLTLTPRFFAFTNAVATLAPTVPLKL